MDEVTFCVHLHQWAPEIEWIGHYVSILREPFHLIVEDSPRELLRQLPVPVAL